MSSSGYQSGDSSFGGLQDIKITSARQPHGFGSPSQKIIRGNESSSAHHSSSIQKSSKVPLPQAQPVTFSNENNYSTPQPQQDLPEAEKTAPIDRDQTQLLSTAVPSAPTSSEEFKSGKLRFPSIADNDPKEVLQSKSPATPPTAQKDAARNPFNEILYKYNELRREAERARKDINELKEKADRLLKDDSEYENLFGNAPQVSDLQASLIDLMKLQLQHNGSALHLKTGSPPMIRLEGELIPVGEKNLTIQDTKRLILPLLKTHHKKMLSNKKSVEFSFSNQLGRFHTNIYLQKESLAASIKYVKTSVLNIMNSGIPHHLIQTIPVMSGLFLITGINGSGKTTTQASIIDYLNQTSKLNIITIEDPIEYIFEDKESCISQKEVGTDIVSMEEGICSALRQDPDVIVVSEIKNSASAFNVLKASETGRLVIASIRASNTIHALLKFINMFSPVKRPEISLLLSENLYTVLAQKLVLSKDMENQIMIPEILNITPNVAPLIASGNYSEIYHHIQECSQEGMVTFNKSLANYVSEDRITEETAIAYSDDPSELMNLLSQIRKN